MCRNIGRYAILGALGACSAVTHYATDLNTIRQNLFIVDNKFLHSEADAQQYHCPSYEWGMCVTFFVDGGANLTIGGFQIYVSYNSSNTYIRDYYGGIWRNWRKVTMEE